MSTVHSSFGGAIRLLTVSGLALACSFQPAFAAVLITIAANTSNEVFTVSGAGCAPGGYTTPQTLQWAPGTSCTVAFVSPYSQQAGTQYVLTGWQDGSTANPRVIVTPAQSTTYTASFETQYQLIGIANPLAGGTVSGGGWVDAGGIATLTATAAAGYRFASWSGSTANPISVQMYGSLTVTASFEPVTNAVLGNWSAMQIAINGTGYGINSYGEVAGQSNQSPFLWVPIAANSVAGTLTSLSGSTTITAATAVNDFGQVLFSYPPNMCCGEYSQASLWTPAVAQGAVGTTTTISTVPGNQYTDTLNNFGQVGAYVNGSMGTWTPAAPNGTTGTFTPNAQLQGLVAMNGFGQAIVNSNFTPLLFTPLAPNGTAGTFTSIVGLAGATQNTLAAIGAGGAVVGYSCVAQNSGSCQDQGFIWTPAASNGISGTTVAMPLPPGFVTVTPTAINSTGSVVGTMAQSSGSAIPFLYIAGTYYDLTTISGVPAGAIPAGINQAGQILLNQYNSYQAGIVYLATPIPLPAAPPAGAVSITITANTSNEVFTISGTGCAPGGYTTPQTLQWAPGTSCTVAFVSPYSQQAGTQYVLIGWQDGSTANPRVIVTPAQSTTYTASFETQYQLIGLASPPAGGTVSGGGWVDAGGFGELTATAAAGYRFASWSGSTANPISVQMYGSLTVTASFEPVTNAVLGNWSAMQIAINGTGYGINSYGEVAGQSNQSPFLWVPIAANSVAGTLTSLSGSTTITAATAVNDFGQVLFSYPPNMCCGEYSQASLWTPAVAQGAVGTTTTISTVPGNQYTDTLNNFGQVGAYVNGSMGTWTPAAPNGTTGTFTPNAQLQGLVAMNGFGQAIVNSNFTPLLFTPLAPNGTAGTFTSIVGLAGATQNTLAAIGAGGAVVGYSCVAQNSGSCQDQGFIWTPAASNGISGTTVAMPLPPGFVTVTPTAINSTGSVVGTMAQSSGSAIPFLYIAGTYYDLTTISGVPAGAIPAGINQAGQILLNQYNSYQAGIVYLATPIPLPAAPPAGAVSITITANTSNEVFTISGTGCAPGGYTTPQTLQWAPGTSCTVAFVSPYSQQAGTQYVLTGWQDGSTANPRVIVTPAQSTTYTASFETQYQLIGIANPLAGGTVSGGGWVDAGGIATLTATAAAGYRFASWSGSTANPISVQMYGSLTVTASFEPVTNAVLGNWSAMQIAINGTGYGINSYGEVAGQSNQSPFLWVPIAANSVAGTLTSLSGSTTITAATAVNDFGQVLFSYPPNMCCGEYSQASLWTPAVAQGAVGTTTTISTVPGNQYTDTLNNFGQVGAYVNGSMGTWTPAAPNGTTGTFTPNAQLQGLVAMNGFGQAIVNSNFTPLLFTPLAPNGTAGTFTSIVGLAGATQNTLAAIGAGGAVVGYSCVAQNSGSCQDQGFIWTPAASNGISGTTVAMPLPPGFVTVTPTAINSTGSVVGTMAQSSGSAIPFLYIAGTYYDLTTISGVPAGAIPAGINQAGQILLNQYNSYQAGIVYLATPPLVVSRPVSLPVGFLNYAYPSTQLVATGGSGVYAWSATGLPVGLSIGTTTGIISGTPLTSSGSPYAVQVNVTDSNSAAAARSYTLTIGAVNPCDLKQTGSITVVDVQLIINEALGITPAVYDLSGTGVVNVVDVQIEINAALGLGCSGQ